MNNITVLIRKIGIDLLLLALFIILGLSLVEKPGPGNRVNLQDTGALQAAGRGPADAKPLLPPKTEPIPVRGDPKIYERNIFSVDGSYASVSDLKQTPESSYNLIAVLRGKEKRAVFREYSGNMVFLKTGDKLIDGSIIADIDKLSVRTKKGSETKEYRIFDVKRKNE